MESFKLGTAERSHLARRAFRKVIGGGERREELRDRVIEPGTGFALFHAPALPHAFEDSAVERARASELRFHELVYLTIATGILSVLAMLVSALMNLWMAIGH